MLCMQYKRGICCIEWRLSIDIMNINYIHDVYASVCLSVCLSRSGIASKRLNIGPIVDILLSHDDRKFQFSVTNRRYEIPTG